MENVDSLVKRALELKQQGMSEHEIGRELHVSENTVVWLITRRVKGEKPPIDVKIGWRSMGVSATRIGYLACIMADIITEEAALRKLEPDTVVGVAINGIPIATMISEELGLDLAIYRPIVSGEAGTISSNFANVKGKQIIIVDDVTGTGETMKAAMRDMRNSGAKPVLALVIVNKTDNIEIDGVPLRSLIRARPIS
ncbi:MAG: orotate phosphoribosyltransferase-like protein [Euryarchaeota archaeon]|nr:orotate phosphoribosyltransferase-like protein [Euryarchaeota archaeon]